jgi:hypothetical protein
VGTTVPASTARRRPRPRVGPQDHARIDLSPRVHLGIILAAVKRVLLPTCWLMFMMNMVVHDTEHHELFMDPIPHRVNLHGDISEICAAPRTGRHPR